MSSEVLYRKYRPKKWSEVTGQAEIVRALSEAVRSKRLSHAYLFSGSRGTGKTTVARILAGEAGAAEEDIYEIDAASNRGIDDIRSLREHVSVLPFSSPFKVYIIDEVHMLSKDAWNALLKTLEEPPRHVIFILATTELDKVPETIVSRCQTFAFRRPSREVIGELVGKVARSEGYSLEAGAADLIALLGDGSFRDALGTLEKVIASSADKKLSLAEVEAITGAPPAALVDSFLAALLSKDCDKSLNVIAEVGRSGLAVETFMTLVLEKARLIMLREHSASTRSDLVTRLSTRSDLVKLLSILLSAAEATPRAAIKTLPLEMAVVEVCERAQSVVI